MTASDYQFTRSGNEGGMTGDELEQFLNQPLICHLACRDDASWPYVVPVWFEWDGSGFWIVPRKRSAWATYLEADPRVGLCIDATHTGERVICQGSAELIEQPNVGGRWVEIAERMAIRYRGEEGRNYLHATLNQPRWLFYVHPGEILSWKGSGWHERYAK